METYLGLDLGGTKLLIGEVDSHGNILRYKKYDSGYFNQQAASEIIKSSLDDYIRTVGRSRCRCAAGFPRYNPPVPAGYAPGRSALP